MMMLCHRYGRAVTHSHSRAVGWQSLLAGGFDVRVLLNYAIEHDDECIVEALMQLSLNPHPFSLDILTDAIVQNAVHVVKKLVALDELAAQVRCALVSNRRCTAVLTAARALSLSLSHSPCSFPISQRSS